MIMFTGSTRTGRKVALAAAERLIPCSLELGGKDPMIVLRDADLERAANVAMYYAMLNGGQTCISIERVYVEEPVYDEFVAKVTEKVRALRQGRSVGPGTADVGSMTFPPQMDIVDGHVQDAVAKGAKVLVGGHRREGEGIFYEPTVLVDVDHTMEAMTEETFGPTLPIMKVRDAEEAIRLANDSIYGLGGSVFTKDLARGEQVAKRVEAGAVCVNDAVINYSALELPMGGAKTSGLGRRHGAGRDPQVLPAAVDHGLAQLPQARAAHVPVHGQEHQAHRQGARLPLRAGSKGLTLRALKAPLMVDGAGAEAALAPSP